ncbi:hypothetical protein ACFW04_014165 [Cataglyphis niger]
MVKDFFVQFTVLYPLTSVGTIFAGHTHTHTHTYIYIYSSRPVSTGLYDELLVYVLKSLK